MLYNNNNQRTFEISQNKKQAKYHINRLINCICLYFNNSQLHENRFNKSTCITTQINSTIQQLYFNNFHLSDQSDNRCYQSFQQKRLITSIINRNISILTNSKLPAAFVITCSSKRFIQCDQISTDHMH